MIDFDEWYEKEIGSENKPEYEASKWAWDYQQAKIDELQARIDTIHDIIEKAKKLRSGNYLINEIDSVLKGNKGD